LAAIPKLYSVFAKYYDRLESQYRDYAMEAAWIESILESYNSQHAIDISCGTGTHLRSLLEIHKDRQYLGMDASEQMLKLVCEKLAKNEQSVEILRGDFLDMPFRPNSFDAVICMYWSLAGLDHYQAKILFREAYKILEPSGILIFDVENAEGIKENLLGSPFIDAFFSDPETASNIIRANLSTKIQPDLIDWHAYYLIEKEGVSELVNDEMKLRFYSRTTLESLLKEAGFLTLQVSSSPGGEYVAGSPSLYFTAQKT
jgi:ubiquinone/menaquinone biosynthesis C-methylase UbiE